MNIKRTFGIAVICLGVLSPRGTCAVSATEALKRYKIDRGYYEWRKTLYEEKRFKAVEDFAGRLLKVGDEESRYKRARFYSTLSAIEKELPESTMRSVLQRWAQQNPKTHIPLLILGTMYFHDAWKERGHGWGKDVTPERQRKMMDRLVVAERYLQKAYAVNPRESEISSMMIGVDRSLGLGRDVMEHHFQNAISLDPGSLSAHYFKFDYVTPKWFGSVEEMLAFANEAKQKAGRYPRLAAVWISAQLELYGLSKRMNTVKNPLKNPEVWNEIESIYRASIARYPDELSWRMNFAWAAMYAEKYQIAAEQFDAVGDRYTPNSQWGPLRDYNAGRARAYEWVGRIYEDKGDILQAIAWFKRGLALGSPFSQYKMAELLEKGQGVVKNDAEALRLYQQAAQTGNAWAMGALGLRYETGKGVPKNRSEADRWIEKATSAGVLDFIYIVAVMNYEGKEVPRDYVRAAEYFKRAADHDDVKGINMMGVMYEHGLGVPQNNEQAAAWYAAAAAKGHVKAKEHLEALKARGK